MSLPPPFLQRQSNLPPMPALTEAAAAADPKKPNYFTRHWRGELPLSVSYWVNGVLGSLLAAFATMTLVAIDDTIDLRLTVTIILVVFAGSLVVIAWQLVGIWRSASNHVSRGGNGFWAALAKVAIVLGIARTIGLIGNSYIPQSKEFVSMLTGDKQLPPYKITLLPGTTEVEFRGGLRAACTKDLERILAAHPQIEALDIESPGGRITEARRMIQLVHQHGLATYTSQYCSSAATLVLMSGKERLISKRAKIGFHAGRIPGATWLQQRVMDNLVRATMRSAGISPEFTDRVLATPSDKMWYPTSREMLDARGYYWNVLSYTTENEIGV